jgi:beta-galactosidase
MKLLTLVSSLVVVTTTLTLAAAADREATLAVVNPAVRSPLAEVISLRGVWQFATDPKGRGREEGWMQPKAAWPGLRTIEVPSCWEAQGVGKQGMGTTWDCHWDCLPRELRHVYRGSAWYRRTVAIPANWNGKRAWLKIGGVRAQGWFWVNGQPVGHVDNYCGAYKYDVTDLVSPGKEATVVALVRNDVPSRKGGISATNCFGGLYRDVELEATPATWIDNVWVQGDVDARKAVVHVAIRSAGQMEKKELSVGVNVTVNVTTAQGTPAGKASRQIRIRLNEKGTADLEMHMPLDEFRPWSPEVPNLYIAEATIARAGDQNHPIHGWRERFGVRKREVRGTDIYLNNKKHFVRGFGDDYIYPITFCSPASREEHRRHLELAKEFGFNYVRHHTHCESPEFYEAADEVGIMIQPELPYYGKHPTEAFTFDPMRDLTELMTHYRRYVSLSTYCMGNEGHLGSPLDHELYAMLKKNDPERLVIHEDGGINTAQNSDYGSGRCGFDWAPYPQEADPRPWINHEFLNLAVSRDARSAPKYTGSYLPPASMESYQHRLAAAGLSRKWGDACLDAGQQLQRIYQKRGLEWARLNPRCNGYIFWTIVSVDGFGDQGLLNQFWEPRASKPDFFRQFNSPTAILCKMTPSDQILTAGDELKMEWWISHFGEKALKGMRLHWGLFTEVRVLQNHRWHPDLILGGGPSAPWSAETGDVKRIDHFDSGTVGNVERPLRAWLTADVLPLKLHNSWDMWLFPKNSARRVESLCASPSVHKILSARYPGLALLNGSGNSDAKTLLTTALDTTARQWLKEGKNVLLLTLAGPAPGVKLGWWGMTGQTGTAIARHPAFGDFPHDGYMDELWFRIVDGTVPAGPPAIRSVEPLMVCDGSLGYLIHVFQAKVGTGKLLASGLNLLSDKPEAAYLLDQFIKYVQSDKFQPAGTLDLHQAEADWELWLALAKSINGWAETTKTFQRVPYQSYWGQRPLVVARQTGKEKLLVWQTRPVPADLDKAKNYTFRWFGALGWYTPKQPPGKFTLALGDRPLVDFDVVDKTATWTSADGSIKLTYTLRGRTGPDSSGIMELTLPARLLTPGKPAELRVIPAQSGSMRWFGVYEWPQEK